MELSELEVLVQLEHEAVYGLHDEAASGAGGRLQQAGARLVQPQEVREGAPVNHTASSYGESSTVYTLGYTKVTWIQANYNLPVRITDGYLLEISLLPCSFHGGGGG